MNKFVSGFQSSDIEVVSREECHKGFLNLEKIQLRHRLHSGGWSEQMRRELLLKPKAVGILLFDPLRDEVLMVRQFRVGLIDEDTDCWPLEIVAGMVAEGEDLQDVAVREAMEESNSSPTNIMEIGQYYNSPGGSNEHITLFCGKVDTQGAEGVYGLAEEHEDIELVPLPYNELVAALGSSMINNAMTIIALQWLILNKQHILNSWLDGQAGE
jgi:ADP-ribose pyrophosphatase